MKTVQIAIAAVLLLVPAIASAQTPSVTPEECAATFSTRLAAARAELETFARQHPGGSVAFVQPRHPENEACLIDDARHRIPLVLRPVPQGEPTTDAQRAEVLRAALSELAVMCYGSTRERCTTELVRTRLHDFVIAMRALADRGVER